MNEHAGEIHESRDAFEIGIWENEGTCVPAGAGRPTLIDPGHPEVADGNAGGWNERLQLDAPTMDAFEIGKTGS